MFAVSRAVDGLLAVAGLQRQSRRVTVPQSSLFWHDRCRQYFLRRKAQVVASACLTAQTGHMRNIRGFYSFEEMGDSCRYSQELSATQVLQRKVVKASTKIVTLQDRLAESQLQKSDAERRIAEAERLLREAERVIAAREKGSSSKPDAASAAPVRMLYASVAACVVAALVFLGGFSRSLERKVLLSLLVPSLWIFVAELRRPSVAGANVCVVINWFLVGFVCHAFLLQPHGHG